jgi:hypothetical protein
MDYRRVPTLSQCKAGKKCSSQMMIIMLVDEMSFVQVLSMIILVSVVGDSLVNKMAFV